MDSTIGCKASSIDLFPASDNCRGSETAPAGSNNAGFRNNPPDDDDEEEEGMLKVDEEGQIEDDGADSR